MPETFHTVAVVTVALLPGALYTWAFERLVGRWGITLSDRVLRFVAGSAIFHAFVSPITYWLWSRYLHSGEVSSGSPLPPALWLAPLAYVAVPFMGGTAV